MAVRWPEGRRYFSDLLTRLERESGDQPVLDFFKSVYELFFPRKYEQVEAMLQQA